MVTVSKQSKYLGGRGGHTHTHTHTCTHMLQLFWTSYLFLTWCWWKTYWEDLTLSSRPFIKILNRIDLSTEPWRTALMTGCQMDVTPFSTLSACSHPDIFTPRRVHHPSHEQLVSPWESLWHISRSFVKCFTEVQIYNMHRFSLHPLRMVMLS